VVQKNEIISHIRQKKELSGVTNTLVEELLEEYLKRHKIFLDTLTKKQEKIIVKEIRLKLRKYTGQFQKSFKDRFKLLEKNKIKELLKTHSSTSERLDFYPKLKKLINSLGLNSILDIACGLNPLALANSSVKYYATDIVEDEIDLIKKFFEKKKIKGYAFICDLRRKNLNLPEADVCLIFKTLDIIGKSHAEKLLDQIKCKYFLVSFSTRKLSGKRMTHPERKWFEALLKRKNLNFKKFSSKNELFYLISRRELKTTWLRSILKRK